MKIDHESITHAQPIQHVLVEGPDSRRGESEMGESRVETSNNSDEGRGQESSLKEQPRGREESTVPAPLKAKARSREASPSPSRALRMGDLQEPDESGESAQYRGTRYKESRSGQMIHINDEKAQEGPVAEDSQDEVAIFVKFEENQDKEQEGEDAGSVEESGIKGSQKSLGDFLQDGNGTQGTPESPSPSSAVKSPFGMDPKLGATKEQQLLANKRHRQMSLKFEHQKKREPPSKIQLPVIGINAGKYGDHYSKSIKVKDMTSPAALAHRRHRRSTRKYTNEDLNSQLADINSDFVVPSLAQSQELSDMQQKLQSAAALQQYAEQQDPSKQALKPAVKHFDMNQISRAGIISQKMLLDLPQIQSSAKAASKYANVASLDGSIATTAKSSGKKGKSPGALPPAKVAALSYKQRKELFRERILNSIMQREREKISKVRASIEHLQIKRGDEPVGQSAQYILRATARAPSDAPNQAGVQEVQEREHSPSPEFEQVLNSSIDLHNDLLKTLHSSRSKKRQGGKLKCQLTFQGQATGKYERAPNIRIDVGGGRKLHNATSITSPRDMNSTQLSPACFGHMLRSPRPFKESKEPRSVHLVSELLRSHADRRSKDRLVPWPGVPGVISGRGYEQPHQVWLQGSSIGRSQRAQKSKNTSGDQNYTQQDGLQPDTAGAENQFQLDQNGSNLEFLNKIDSLQRLQQISFDERSQQEEIEEPSNYNATLNTEKTASFQTQLKVAPRLNGRGGEGQLQMPSAPRQSARLLVKIGNQGEDGADADIRRPSGDFDIHMEQQSVTNSAGIEDDNSQTQVKLQAKLTELKNKDPSFSDTQTHFYIQQQMDLHNNSKILPKRKQQHPKQKSIKNLRRTNEQHNNSLGGTFPASMVRAELGPQLRSVECTNDSIKVIQEQESSYQSRTNALSKDPSGDIREEKSLASIAQQGSPRPFDNMKKPARDISKKSYMSPIGHRKSAKALDPDSDSPGRVTNRVDGSDPTVHFKIIQEKLPTTAEIEAVLTRFQSRSKAAGFQWFMEPGKLPRRHACPGVVKWIAAYEDRQAKERGAARLERQKIKQQEMDEEYFGRPPGDLGLGPAASGEQTDASFPLSFLASGDPAGPRSQADGSIKVLDDQVKLLGGASSAGQLDNAQYFDTELAQEKRNAPRLSPKASGPLATGEVAEARGSGKGTGLKALHAKYMPGDFPNSEAASQYQQLFQNNMIQNKVQKSSLYRDTMNSLGNLPDNERHSPLITVEDGGNDAARIANLNGLHGNNTRNYQSPDGQFSKTDQNASLKRKLMHQTQIADPQKRDQHPMKVGHAVKPGLTQTQNVFGRKASLPKGMNAEQDAPGPCVVGAYSLRDGQEVRMADTSKTNSPPYDTPHNMAEFSLGIRSKQITKEEASQLQSDRQSQYMLGDGRGSSEGDANNITKLQTQAGGWDPAASGGVARGLSPNLTIMNSSPHQHQRGRASPQLSLWKPQLKVSAKVIPKNTKQEVSEISRKQLRASHAQDLSSHVSPKRTDDPAGGMHSQLLHDYSQNPSLKLVGPAGIPQAGAPSQSKFAGSLQAPNAGGSPFLNSGQKPYGKHAGARAGGDKSALGEKSVKRQQHGQPAGGKLSALAHATADARELTQRAQEQPQMVQGNTFKGLMLAQPPSPGRNHPEALLRKQERTPQGFDERHRAVQQMKTLSKSSQVAKSIGNLQRLQQEFLRRHHNDSVGHRKSKINKK